MPFVRSWSEFLEYFDKMRGYGVVESMKDFYWDIRPRPEYGTVEIRVFDTPLSVDRAAALAAYTQALARHLLKDRPRPPSREVYLLYNHNRFQACRYGLGGKLIDADTGRQVLLKDDVLETIALVAPHAAELGGFGALRELESSVRNGEGDAEWLRRAYRERGTLSDVARLQSDLWMGLARPAAR
jgi:carboxylate-amine ligase